MAYTSKQLADLEAAIAEGALEVEYDGKKTRYRSLEHMRSIRDEIRASLGITTKGRTRRVASYKRGT